MSCCQPSEATIQELRKSLAEASVDFEFKDNVTDLLRGGVVVKTKAGRPELSRQRATRYAARVHQRLHDARHPNAQYLSGSHETLF